MAYGTRATFEAVREVAFGGIGATYAAVGTATTDFPRQISIYNSTNTDVYISFNGSTDHIRVASGTGQVHDITANKVRDDGLFLHRNTIFYCRRAAGAPTSGNVWIQVLVAEGGV